MTNLTFVCAREDEIITPHQTVLLKLLDSYLQTAHLTVEMCQQLCPMIASTFFDLGEYSISTIDRAIPNISSLPSAPPSLSSFSSGMGTSISPTLVAPEPSLGHVHPSPAQMLKAPLTTGELDMLLPSACEALVLMTQCLITFALTSEDGDFDFPPGDNPKDFLNAAMIEEGVGTPEIIISTFQCHAQGQIRG